ncbi:MAG: lipopolysaccharide biosynthesis protein [Candidatus Omnitrophica bacterium]|nr:lipopolysaccharide biosynthesis protein [Candidatus Omnitrophota bacterium]
MKSLKQKTVSGVKWEIVNKVLQKVISVVSFAVLARILEPSSFGLFALAFVAIDGLNLVRSFGLDSALIQRKESVQEASDTTFFLVLASGIVIFFICQVIAPYVGIFFKNREVAPVMRALGAIFLLNSISKVPSALLAKQMEYKKIAFVGLCGSVTNSVLAIGFALISPTVWSLVWAYVIKQLVITVISWRMAGYRLKWSFEWKAARELFRFGKFMLGLGFLWYLSVNLDDIVIGKMLGTVMVGYFAVSNNVANFINTHFTQLVSGVMFPAYARIQDDAEALHRVYLKTIKFISILSIPFSIGLIFLSEEFVYTLYGSKWQPIVRLVRLYGFVQLIAPIKACSTPVFMAKGRPDYSFNLTLCGLLIRIPLLVILLKQFGLIGSVISELIVVVLFAPINLELAKKIVHFQYAQLFGQLSASLWSGAAMAGSIILLKEFLPIASPAQADYHLLKLLILGGTGVLTYFGTYYLLDRKSVVEAKQLVFNLKDNPYAPCVKMIPGAKSDPYEKGRVIDDHNS